MGEDTLEPFRCPAQECHDDEQDLTLEDAKRFYLHWYSAHKPRCPRTDCKFSLKDLSKTTGSYFLRHWATHFPELKIEQSACSRCGRCFANANNRDRHASRCNGSVPEADRADAEPTIRQRIMEHPAGQVQTCDPRMDWTDWYKDTTAPDCFDTILDDQQMAALLRDYELPSFWADEPSSLPKVTVPIRQPQISTWTAESGSDYTVIEQTFVTSVPQISSSEPEQSTRVVELNQVMDEDYTGSFTHQTSGTQRSESTTSTHCMPSNSLKRTYEGGTTESAKRHQSDEIHIGHQSAGSKLSKPLCRVSYEDYTWKRKLTCEPCIKCKRHVSRVLINDVLISKKTRFPRVRIQRARSPVTSQATITDL
jgi:hypothetical protein